MCPERSHRPTADQAGFTLVAALFLLVVLAGLAAVAVRLAGVQQQTVNLAIQSARAFQAATSGVEYAAYRALSGGFCGASTVNYTEGGLAGFTVTTSCSSSAHAEGASVTTVYLVEAFARSGVYGAPDYVSRRIRATVTDAT